MEKRQTLHNKVLNIINYSHYRFLRQNKLLWQNNCLNLTVTNSFYGTK